LKVKKGESTLASPSRHKLPYHIALLRSLIAASGGTYIRVL